MVLIGIAHKAGGLSHFATGSDIIFLPLAGAPGSSHSVVRYKIHAIFLIAYILH